MIFTRRVLLLTERAASLWGTKKPLLRIIEVRVVRLRNRL